MKSFNIKNQKNNFSLQKIGLLLINERLYKLGVISNEEYDHMKKSIILKGAELKE